MSHGILKVGFGQLDTAAADLQQAAARIDGRLDQLEARLEVLRADWSGQASEAYQVCRRQWETAMNDMQGLLADLGRAVSASNDAYRATERANAGMFNG